MAKEARPRNQLLLTEEELEAHRAVLLEGIQQYNDGYFFEAHETWEDYWYASPPPYRDFLQGLIQVAAGFVHLARHQFPGTIRLLDEALKKLDRYPDDFMRVDVARLRDEARRAREELAALGPERFAEWDRERIPRMHVLEV